MSYLIGAAAVGEQLIAIAWRFKWQAIILILLIVCAVLNSRADREQDKRQQVIADFERLELKRQAETTSAILAAREDNFNKVIEAINENAQKQKQIELDIVSVNAANDSLRDTIDKIDASIDRLPEAAKAAYSDTRNDILQECSGEVSGLAGTLDKVLAERDFYYKLAGGE